MTDDEFQHDDVESEVESGVPALELPPTDDDQDDEPGDEEEPDASADD